MTKRIGTPTASEAPGASATGPDPATTSDYHPTPPIPDAEPRAEPAPPITAPDVQEQGAPAIITAGPALAMTAETVAAVGAALWHVGGWGAVIGAAAGAAGLGAAAAGRVVRARRRSRSWRTGTTRSWSTSTPHSTGRRMKAGHRVPASFGSGGRRTSGAGRSRTGRSAFGRSRTGSASAGRRAAARLGSSRPVRSATKAGRATSRAARTGAHATGRAARTARRETAARARRAARAAHAAHSAMRSGGTPRAAARAAREAGRRRPGDWERLSGSIAWTIGGWLWGLAYRAGAAIVSGFMTLVRLRRGKNNTAAAEAPDRPRIDTTVNRPASGSSGAGTTTGGTTMPGGVPIFVAAAEDLAASLKRYEPPPGAGGMYQMLRDVKQFPNALEEIASGLMRFSEKARDEWPLNPAISGLLEQMAQVQHQMAAVAQDIPDAIERLHEKELERFRAPRPSEERWNV